MLLPTVIEHIREPLQSFWGHDRWLIDMDCRACGMSLRTMHFVSPLSDDVLYYLTDCAVQHTADGCRAVQW